MSNEKTSPKHRAIEIIEVTEDRYKTTDGKLFALEDEAVDHQTTINDTCYFPISYKVPSHSKLHKFDDVKGYAKVTSGHGAQLLLLRDGMQQFFGKQVFYESDGKPISLWHVGTGVEQMPPGESGQFLITITGRICQFKDSTNIKTLGND